MQLNGGARSAFSAERCEIEPRRVRRAPFDGKSDGARHGGSFASPPCSRDSAMNFDIEAARVRGPRRAHRPALPVLMHRSDQSERVPFSVPRADLKTCPQRATDARQPLERPERRRTGDSRNSVTLTRLLVGNGTTRGSFHGFESLARHGPRELPIYSLKIASSVHVEYTDAFYCFEN